MSISDLFSWSSRSNAAVDTKPALKQEPVDTSSQYIIRVLHRCLPTNTVKGGIEGLKARARLAERVESLVSDIRRVDAAYAVAIAKADDLAPKIEEALAHAMGVVESSRKRLAELDKAQAGK